MVDFGISQSVYLTENRHGTTSLDAGDRLMKSNLFRLLDMLLKDVFNRWVDGVYKVSLYLCVCVCVRYRKGQTTHTLPFEEIVRNVKYAFNIYPSPKQFFLCYYLKM